MSILNTKKPVLPATTHFKFVLDNLTTFNNLDALKMNNYNAFIKINDIGKRIHKAIQNQDLEELEKIIDKNFMSLPYLKAYIDDGFIEALHFRDQQIVEYFLKNGYVIENNCDDALITVCNSLEYLKGDDAPDTLFQILLKYGAPLNECQDDESKTALHLAAQYGCEKLVKLLIEYGADIDAVDNNKKTPLNYAREGKHEQAVRLLESVNAKSDWKYCC